MVVEDTGAGSGPEPSDNGEDKKHEEAELPSREASKQTGPARDIAESLFEPDDSKAPVPAKILSSSTPEAAMQPTMEPGSQESTTPSETASPRFRQIGPYKLLRRIAHGGMGEIYLARKEGLDKDLALKVMLEMLEGFPDLRARFFRETQVLARAEHPNICPILDAGEHEGCPYYARVWRF